MCFMSTTADVGADILDLAETMITSNGLQYEPVSKTHLETSCHVWHYVNRKVGFIFVPLTTASLLFVCLFRLFLS